MKKLLYNFRMNVGISKAIAHFGSVTKTAKAVGVSIQAIRFYRDGRSPCAEKVAVKIERLTGGRVTRKELRPDWKEIWPELEG